MGKRSMNQRVIGLKEWLINIEWGKELNKTVRNIHYIGKLEHHRIRKEIF
jgi:hypothetical protein